MKLSKNLSLGEFTRSQTAKRKGIDNTPNEKHLEAAKLLAENIFQPIRDCFATPIFISSGYRSDALNEAIGGSKTSQHSKGEAIDIDMDYRSGPENEEIFHYIRENLPFDQLIWEFGTDERPDWVHVSYNSDGEQRGQILTAKRNSAGKTYYVKSYEA
jgi:hypothetical protein